MSTMDDRLTCVRCGITNRHPLNRWPEGPVCRACIRKGLLHRGVCPGCEIHRPLPGRRDDTTPICRDCAGIHRDFICTRCGHEGVTHRGRLCTKCTLTDRLDQLLDDGTGRINPALHPLATLLLNTPTAEGTLNWLRRRSAPTLLVELATGQLELTHAALDARGSTVATYYLRQLLVAAGILPRIDKVLLDFERWLRTRLDTLTDHPHQRLLRQFGLWHQLPRMRTKAALGPLGYGAYVYAQQQITAAESLMTWLVVARRHPADLTQADLDTWLLTARRSERERIRSFLNWASANRHLPKRRAPRPGAQPTLTITQQHRLALLKRCATDTTITLSTRVIASLILLYAQPLTRIRHLTTDDIVCGSDRSVHIRLGEPASPVPHPFDQLLLELAAGRDLNIAANATGSWLFPGRSAGQPITYPPIRKRLDTIGISPGITRVSTLRQLVQQIPAPVVGTALGFHRTTTTRQSANAGGTWSRYASPDVTQRHASRVGPSQYNRLE
jgi:hypothetical protein